MPTLKRACMYPMCSNYAQRRSHYCEKHDAATKAMSQSMYNERRGTAASRGYDRRWRKIRLMQLRAEPLCVSCGGAATEVDHITPLAAGGTHAFSNLQSMCKSCHSAKTAGENGGFGRTRSREGEGASKVQRRPTVDRTGRQIFTPSAKPYNRYWR